MKTNIELNKLDLPGKTILKEIGPGHIAIVKDRKSRIIMKDGEQILQIARKIRKKYPDIKVSLSTSAPVCSKTESFLGKSGVDILPLIK